MHLKPGRVRDMVDESIAAGGAITCHKTLRYGEHPEFGEAMCRGFYDAVGDRTNIIRVVHRLGGFAEVPPPDAQPVVCTPIAATDEHEVRATVEHAPVIHADDHHPELLPTHVEVGYERRGDNAWRVRYLLVLGATTRDDDNGHTWSMRTERRYVPSRRDEWPAWLGEFVDQHTPAGEAAA
jgi:hypothetical protein